MSATLHTIQALVDGWNESGFGRCGLHQVEGKLWLSADGEALSDPCAAEDLPSLLVIANALDQQMRASQPTVGINGATTTKSRGRPMAPDVGRRRDRLVEMARASQPATVRQLYYLAETEGLVDKSENGYRRVQHDVLLLRREGRIPYDWISDNTRWMRKSGSYKGIAHFLNLTIATYRRDLWANASARVEIWVEKDALAGVIMEETDPFDVPLMVARGCSSETYLYETAQAISAHDKPAYIYHFGDHDPTGRIAAAHIESRLRAFAPDTEIYFQCVAVTPDQIAEWSLPTRATKREGNRHARNFDGDSCELDAIPPLKLRELVRSCILRHVDRRQLAVLREAEESERSALTMFARSWSARQ